MTLCTSVTEREKSEFRMLKISANYLLVSALCIVFDKVYAIFGHGVESPSMSLMFLYPFIGGTSPFIILWLSFKNADKIKHYRFCFNCYNSGIAVLTVRSMLKGILDIAGTSSPYLIYFLITGCLMVFVGLLIFSINLYKYCKNEGAAR